MNDETAGYLSDGTYRARWLRAVIKAAHITESVRVLLMTLALHMDASGRVSVPRDELAALLGRNERKVGERVKLALESGLLVRTVRGQKHRTAVYQAALDGAVLSVPPVGPADDSQGAGSMPPEPDSQGAGSMPPETQGAGFRMSHGGPAEDSQQAPRGAHLSYMGVDVVEEVSVEDSDSLFDVAPKTSRAEPQPDEPSKRRTQVPKDFAPTPEMRAWAAKTTPLVDVAFETEQFIDHWTGKREVRADWVATWRTWMRNQQKWSRPHGGQTPATPQGNGSGSQVPPRGAPRQNPFPSKRETA